MLESVHGTLEEAIINRLKLYLGDYGSLLLPIVLFQFSFFIDTLISELNPISQIASLNAPALFISGTHDAHTTQSEVERMYATAVKPKELWIVPVRNISICIATQAKVMKSVLSIFSGFI